MLESIIFTYMMAIICAGESISISSHVHSRYNQLDCLPLSTVTASNLNSPLRNSYVNKGKRKNQKLDQDSLSWTAAIQQHYNCSPPHIFKNAKIPRNCEHEVIICSMRPHPAAFSYMENIEP